jgi:hypothetical protein
MQAVRASSNAVHLPSSDPSGTTRGELPVYPWSAERAVFERSTLLFPKLTLIQLAGAVLVLSFIAGFAVFLLTGATTDRGTTSAIASENAVIMNAERTSCRTFGSYATIPTLRREGLLTFKPTYNSVVYLPGKHCGTIVVGSPAYQSSAG